MGWFDEQIKQRKLSDQEVFEDSFLTLASAVLGNTEGNKIEDQRFLSEKAIDDILMYYHKKPIDIPDEIDDLYEQLEYALRPNGFMYRSIKLEENWFKDAIGPVLAFYNDNSGTVAFIPNGLTYSYFDPKTGKKVILNSERMKEFADDGICFYQPLPLKKLGIPDLLLYMKNCMDVSDLVLFIGVTLFMTLVGFISPKLTQLLTGPVLNSKNVNALIAIAIVGIWSAIGYNMILLLAGLQEIPKDYYEAASIDDDYVGVASFVRKHNVVFAVDACGDVLAVNKVFAATEGYDCEFLFVHFGILFLFFVLGGRRWRRRWLGSAF